MINIKIICVGDLKESYLKDMEKEYNYELHNENMMAFEYILSLSESEPAVWAAWGAIIEKRPYLADCVREMVEIGNRAGAVWYHAGPISVKGHPHHPLYLKSETPLEPFDVQGYLQKV